jgi:hypothetical protein
MSQHVVLRAVHVPPPPHSSPHAHNQVSEQEVKHAGVLLLTYWVALSACNMVLLPIWSPIRIWVFLWLRE